MPLNWKASREEHHQINAIVARARRAGFAPRDLAMDITAAHLNGCPLDLAAFASAESDADFLHDVAGIHRHIDRETGKLRNCFLPRFAA